MLALNLCAANEYADGWVMFSKELVKFLLDSVRLSEAEVIINELVEVLPDDEDIKLYQKALQDKSLTGKFPLFLGVLQNIRFMLAMIEKYPNAYVPIDFKPCIDYLNRYFSYRPTYADADTPDITVLSFSHELPQVKIGQKSWPLLFPAQMIDRCQMKKTKKIEYSFTGIKTQKRVEFLQKWIENQTGDKISLVDKNEYYWGNSHIIFSDKGRVFPEKVWDEQYFQSLQETMFVVCPNGDFIWTYRFFEAIMCRAIPVVEDVCEHYDGFKFYVKDDTAINYSTQWVEHNLQLLISRLTLL